MYRKINKGRSVNKILIYSVILTWFTVVLLENWRNMRISWFREVWEFIDFKAIWENIDKYLGIGVVFGAAIIGIYMAIAMIVRIRRDADTISEHFEEPDYSPEEYLAKMQAKHEDDLINNPAYYYLPGNIWYQKMKHNDEDNDS